MKQTHIKCRHCIMFITLYSTVTSDEVGLYLYSGMKLQQTEHCLHVNKSLPCLAVNRAKKVERNGQLKQQSIHHHQIAYSHCSYTQQPCVDNFNSFQTGNQYHAQDVVSIQMLQAQHQEGIWSAIYHTSYLFHASKVVLPLLMQPVHWIRKNTVQFSTMIFNNNMNTMTISRHYNIKNHYKGALSS